MGGKSRKTSIVNEKLIKKIKKEMYKIQKNNSDEHFLWDENNIENEKEENVQ